MQNELTEAQRVVSKAMSQVGLLLQQGTLPAPWLGAQGRPFRGTVASILKDAADSLARAHMATYDVELTCVERGIQIPHLNEAEIALELSAKRAAKAQRLFASSEFGLNQAKPSARSIVGDIQASLGRLHKALSDAHEHMAEAVVAFPAYVPALQAVAPSPTKAVNLPPDVIACLPLTVAPRLDGTVCLLHQQILVDKDATPTLCYLLAVKESVYKREGDKMVRTLAKAISAPWLGDVKLCFKPRRRQGYCVFPMMRTPCKSWEFVR